MPQFDKITFFNQIFWLLFFFISFYFILLKTLLPTISAGLKTRKKIINFFLFTKHSEIFGLTGCTLHKKSVKQLKLQYLTLSRSFSVQKSLLFQDFLEKSFIKIVGGEKKSR